MFVYRYMLYVSSYMTWNKNMKPQLKTGWGTAHLSTPLDPALTYLAPLLSLLPVLLQTLHPSRCALAWLVKVGCHVCIASPAPPADALHTSALVSQGQQKQWALRETHRHSWEMVSQQVPGDLFSGREWSSVAHAAVKVNNPHEHPTNSQL